MPINFEIQGYNNYKSDNNNSLTTFKLTKNKNIMKNSNTNQVENLVAEKKSRNTAKTKKVVETTTTDLIIVKQVTKTKINKTIQLLETLIKVSGATRENVISFLMQNLASRKEKIKIQDLLTQLILKVASGTLVISNEDKTKTSQIFVGQMVENFDFDKVNFEKFVIQTLASKNKRVSLNTFFKDMFFKASTNKEFVLKIKSFKRF